MQWTEFIKEKMEEEAKEKAIDFVENVGTWIKACREAGGIPVFRTKYAGERIYVDGEPAVLAVCYGSEGRVPSVWFKNVPPSDYGLIEREIGEWRELAYKYAKGEKPHEEYKKEIEAGIRKKMDEILESARYAIEITGNSALQKNLMWQEFIASLNRKGLIDNKEAEKLMRKRF